MDLIVGINIKNTKIQSSILLMVRIVFAKSGEDILYKGPYSVSNSPISKRPNKNTTLYIMSKILSFLASFVVTNDFINSPIQYGNNIVAGI